MAASLVASILLASPGSLFAQNKAGAGASKTPSQPVYPAHDLNQPAKTPWANFAWLEGMWQGNWGPRIAEQLWTAPEAGGMVGVFREIENDKTLVIELYSMVETPDGIEWRSRHFTPSLVPWEPSGPVVLDLASSEPNEIVFENPLDGKPKRAVITRTGPDTYIWRTEIVPDQGDTQTVEITYHRQTPSAGNAGRR